MGGRQVAHGLCPGSNGRSLCRYSCLKTRVAVVTLGLGWYIPTRKSLLLQIRLPSAFPTQKALPDPHVSPSNPGLCSRAGNHMACNNLMGSLINLEPGLFLGSPWSRNVGSPGVRSTPTRTSGKSSDDDTLAASCSTRSPVTVGRMGRAGNGRAPLPAPGYAFPVL